MAHTDIMRGYGASLSLSVRRNAGLAVGENDAEILLSLAENLIAACSYDEGAARTVSEHSADNVAATAYGALIRGSAVGEGFAMAYKALCDELGFDCRIVLGYHNGMVHAWNIVSLYGEYYHIDVAMCAKNDIRTAFLKRDADFRWSYSWDTDETVRCNGTMTLDDIRPPEIEDPDPIEGEDGEDGEDGEEGEEGSEEVTGRETGGEPGGETGEEPGEEHGEEHGEETGEKPEKANHTDDETAENDTQSVDETTEP